MSDETILAEIGTERDRQIHSKHYTAEHDDGWVEAELARAAAGYALPPDVGIGHTGLDERDCLAPAEMRLKRCDRRTELIRAAALIVAEIGRLDRLEP